MVSRREFVQFGAAAVGAPAFCRIASAQTYPIRPITVIVPVAAGGPADAVMRILAERMRQLRQPIIIENVGGADGAIGAGRTARARPDGYTIEFGFQGNHVLNGAVYSLTYDVLNDFAPIAPLGAFIGVLVAKKTMPAKDLNELIAWLKTHPNKVSMGIASMGMRLVAILFQEETGTRFTFVPYRGVAPARQDLVAGQIDLVFDIADALSLVRAGSIKAYAVMSDARSALAPDVPTFRELGLPAVSWPSWWGLFAPKGTSNDIITKLNAAAVDALADPLVRSRVADLGFEIFPRERQTPEALGALVKTDAERLWPIINQLGISGSAPTVPIPPT